jgi:hypothetical protein
VYRIKKLKESGQGPTKGCRAITTTIIIIIISNISTFLVDPPTPYIMTAVRYPPCSLAVNNRLHMHLMNTETNKGRKFANNAF